jgi:hypothetical protein
MRRLVYLLFLLTAVLVAANRGLGPVSIGDNGVVAPWLPIPEGLAVVRANYDGPDFDFDAGRGNVRFRSPRPVAELKRAYEGWFKREGFVFIDGMHRVILAQPAIQAFAMYACHPSKGRFLNIVGSEVGSTGDVNEVNVVYWESRDLAMVQSLFGLKPGERPC